MLLKIENATTRFGGLVANDHINMEIEKGDIVGLIGPNGAGKSTIFKSIVGFNPLSEGRIFFKGQSLSGKMTHKICRLGITCTFQHAQLFTNISLEESVLMGAYCRKKTKAQARALALEMINFTGLAGREKLKISGLNMFERKKAELAAALATGPELLLLDELFAGLVPTEIQRMLDLIRRVHGELGITLFIVEHVLRVIMSLCTKIYVLEYGHVIAQGTPESVTQNPLVIKAYLGEDYDASRDIQS
ncbi:MAG: ATP-binding cassette domain-containing protein [Spirochaetales bacterium]|jgi:branched-chain amino acid transport system ATP-binding protein|nr:ATP-binding cassette domain-containing protein [Spirochaetales bacterium]